MDVDYGENVRLEYFLIGVVFDIFFVINSVIGWVFVSGFLDREFVEYYFFGVEVRDYGLFLFSVLVSVIVIVLDVNDNRFEFIMKEYYLRLNEDVVVGISVVSVIVVDRDVNSVISY